MNNLKVGDVVEMASGSPKMTISKIECVCLWFDENNMLHETTCSPEALTLFKAESYDINKAPNDVERSIWSEKHEASTSVTDLVSNDSVVMLEKSLQDNIKNPLEETMNISVSTNGDIVFSDKLNESE